MTAKNPGLGARMNTVSSALAVSRTAKPDTPGQGDAPVSVTALSVRLPKPMYAALLDIVTEGKKRGDKVSIHSLMLDGIAKVIAEHQ